LITAWRICKQKYSATAFDGYGASRNGGRWNSSGVSVVYTSAVASLAFLEMLVHADATIASLSYVLIPIEFDDQLVTEVDQAGLPADWRDKQSVTRQIGDDWVRASRSAVLKVPSAILTVDQNYIINPAHPDMRRLQIGASQPLIVDGRFRALFAGR
jgi:RES domain-containing protein